VTRTSRGCKGLPIALVMARSNGEEQSTREACVQLGTALLEDGKDLGRKYLWMAVQYGQSAGSKSESLENLVRKMRR